MRHHRPATHLWYEMPVGGVCSVSASRLCDRDRNNPDTYDERVDVIKIAPGSGYFSLRARGMSTMVNAIAIETGELGYVPGGLGVIMKQQQRV